MSTWIVVLALVAGLLACVELARSRFQALLAWAVLALAFALALPRL